MNYLINYSRQEVSHNSLVKLCLYLSIFLLPFKRFTSLGWIGLPKGITLAKISIALTFLFWIMESLISKNSSFLASPFRRILNTAIILGFCVCIFSLLNAVDPGAAIPVIVSRIGVIVLYVLLITIVKDNNTLRIVIVTFLLGAALNGLAGIYELIKQNPVVNAEYIIEEELLHEKDKLIEESGRVRIQGLVAEPGYHAYLSVVSIGLVLGACAYIVKSRPGRFLVGALLLLLIINVFIATSRTGWIGMFGTISTFLLFMRYRHKWLLIISLIFLINIIFVGLILFSNTPIISRLTGDSGYASISLREVETKLSLAMFSSNPIMGIGTGNYPVVSHRWLRKAPGYVYTEATNIGSTSGYIQVLVDNGLIGFSIYCLMVLSFITLQVRIMRHSRKKWQRNMALGFLSSFIGHLIILVTYHVSYSDLMYLLMGLGMALFNLYEEEENVSSWNGVSFMTVPYPGKTAYS